MLGWVLAVVSPVLLLLTQHYVPMPGMLLAAVAIIGGYVGYLLYEHAYIRTRLTRKTVKEQLVMAVMIGVLFSFTW